MSRKDDWFCRAVQGLITSLQIKAAFVTLSNHCALWFASLCTVTALLPVGLLGPRSLLPQGAGPSPWDPRAARQGPLGPRTITANYG